MPRGTAAGRNYMDALTGTWVVWLATKAHWRDPSKLEWVDAGLAAMRDQINFGPKPKIESVAIPALGCGLGGLNWADVLPLIEKHFADCPATVYVYGPGGA